MEIGTFEYDYVFNGFVKDNVINDISNDIYFHDISGYCYYKINNYHKMLFLNEKKINISYEPIADLDLKTDIDNNGNKEFYCDDFLEMPIQEQQLYLNQQYVSYLKNNNSQNYDKKDELENEVTEHLKITKHKNKEHIKKLIGSTIFTENASTKLINPNIITDSSNTIYFDNSKNQIDNLTDLSCNKYDFFNEYKFPDSDVLANIGNPDYSVPEKTSQNVFVKTIFKYDNEELYKKLSIEIEARTVRFDKCHFFIIKLKGENYYPTIILHDLDRYRIFLLFFENLKLEGYYNNKLFQCSTEINKPCNGTKSTTIDKLGFIIDLSNDLTIVLNGKFKRFNFFLYGDDIFFTQDIVPG